MKATPARKVPPLSAFVQRIFLDEIYLECKFVLRANEALHAALGSPIKETADIEPHVDSIWYAIQNLLVAAANISKLLWGDFEDATVNQRAPLRKRLTVGPKSPLKRRDLRNQFEHVDVRIVNQFTGPNAITIYVGRNIGPPPMVSGTKTPRFHHYDDSTGLLTFWKDSVSIPAIVQEVQRILPIAREARLQ